MSTLTPGGHDGLMCGRQISGSCQNSVADNLGGCCGLCLGSRELSLSGLGFIRMNWQVTLMGQRDHVLHNREW